MEFEKTMLSRKSCRAFKEEPVAEELLEKVVTSASMAPLGLPKMCTPVLTVVTDKAALAKLEGHYNVPALIICSCPPIQVPGIDHQNAGCVVEMMALEATSLGLSNIYLYGVTAKLAADAELMKEFGIPDGYVPLAALGLGHGVEDVAVCKEFVPKLKVNRI